MKTIFLLNEIHPLPCEQLLSLLTDVRGASFNQFRPPRHTRYWPEPACSRWQSKKCQVEVRWATHCHTCIINVHVLQSDEVFISTVTGITNWSWYDLQGIHCECFGAHHTKKEAVREAVWQEVYYVNGSGWSFPKYRRAMIVSFIWLDTDSRLLLFTLRVEQV